jgi:membrane protein DedA with SNARE-associated domain
MDQQAKVAARNGAPKTASQGLARDVGAFANDALTLTELQSQLLVADLRECSRRALVPSLVLLGGVALGLACFPIVLVTVALGLVQFLETSHFTAFLIVVVAGAIGSALLCIVGWIQVRQRAEVLQRSRDELVRNLRWIKQVVASTRLT